MADGDACDLAIVGAGAAGLATAIFAAEAAGRTARIVLLDGAKALGAKILVSGGGRCNVTHERVTPEDFNGPRARVKNVLAAFGADDAARWFERLGVPLKREPTGKLFPRSDKARTVLEALVARCGKLGVDVRTEHHVQGVALHGDPPRFRIDHARGTLEAARAVLATGGRSIPKSGSDGAGYELARALGHTVAPTWPALVPLVLASGFFHASLSGISHDAELTTRIEGTIADRRTGSLLWTHFGISGPVVLDASRHWVGARSRGAAATMSGSLLPGWSFAEADRFLASAADEHPRRSVALVLASRLPERVAAAIAAHAGAGEGTRLADLGREPRRALARALVDLPLPVVRDRGWNYAEVTAGGVPLDEVDYRTMESRRARGLYLVGEILDCDGRIGGFNFQWAWATGHVAGTAAGRALRAGAAVRPPR